MLKLAGLCLAAAICLCGVRSLACGGGSGCRPRTVLLRSGKESSELFCFTQMLAAFRQLGFMVWVVGAAPFSSVSFLPRFILR